MNITLFEDSSYKNLLPLVYFRPVWELRCGVTTLAEKIGEIMGCTPNFLARHYIENYCLAENVPNQSPNQKQLFVNGRWLFSDDDRRHLEALPENGALCYGETVLAFYANGDEIAAIRNKDGSLAARSLLSDRQTVSADVLLINYLWDAVNANGEQISADYQRLAEPGYAKARIMDGVYMVNPDQVTVEAGSVVMPGVVIDATHGPVWIDSEATIMANAVLEGPLYVGKKSRIKIGAKIYENTTIGPVCKVGGEVEGSIIHGYSNKQHDGFLGHAYLGEWVNLGADTNNSDLKNNYGIVSAFVNGLAVSTGSQFVGLLMGDHSKTAINTMFNTGTVVGVNSNIFGAGMPPKFVPSFSWGGAEGFVDYDFEKAVGVATAVMARRKIDFDDRTRALFEAVQNLAGRVEKRD